MLPEEKARVKIDKQLNNAGWDIVDRKDYLPNYAMAVKEALMQGGKGSINAGRKRKRLLAFC